MYVDLALRLSTRAFTTTLPNSVSRQLGIFSVSSRSRAAVGFHSTDLALTSYATIAPSHGDTRWVVGRDFVSVPTYGILNIPPSSTCQRREGHLWRIGVDHWIRPLD